MTDTAEMRLAEKLAREGYRIQKANEAFAKMTNAEKRVAIAKDVLAAIALERIVPTGSTYGFASGGGGGERKTLDDSNPTCNACALGSMFVCQTILEKGVTNKIRLSSSPQSALARCFEQSQLEAIEAHFEGWSDDYPSPYNKRDAAQARDRMEAIMKNIIAHDGTFIP